MPGELHELLGNISSGVWVDVVLSTRPLLVLADGVMLRNYLYQRVVLRQDQTSARTFVFAKQ